MRPVTVSAGQPGYLRVHEVAQQDEAGDALGEEDPADLFVPSLVALRKLQDAIPLPQPAHEQGVIDRRA